MSDTTIRLPRPISNGWTQEGMLVSFTIPDEKEAELLEEHDWNEVLSLENASVKVRVNRNEATRTETLYFELDFSNATKE